MKRFMSCMNLVEAHHVANLLGSAGIRSELRNTFLAGAVGELPFMDVGPQIWIDERQDEAVARKIVEESRQAPLQAAWVCDSCGEPSEGQFAQCWNCGAPRPFACDG